jgi:hypothetical protein
MFVGLWFYNSRMRNFSASRFFLESENFSDSIFYLVILPSKNSGIRIFSGSNRIFPGISRILNSTKKRETTQNQTTSFIKK